MPVATSGSARLSYQVEGDGVPVLLLHAGVTDQRSWAPLLAVAAGAERPLPSADERLASVSVPTLVLCGELDDVPLPTTERLARTIPDATFVLLSGTAHVPHLEGHRRCLGAIRDFLARMG